MLLVVSHCNCKLLAKDSPGAAWMRTRCVRKINQGAMFLQVMEAKYGSALPFFPEDVAFGEKTSASEDMIVSMDRAKEGTPLFQMVVAAQETLASLISIASIQSAKKGALLISADTAAQETFAPLGPTATMQDALQPNGIPLMIISSSVF